MGSSAGGLEAYELFFKKMPAKSGISFIIVSHLAPNHVSLLPDLIQKQTQMKVLQISDGQKIERDHVYVMPPNKNLNILNGSLYLMELSKPHGLNLPIDYFFRSLAQDQGSNSICIILSGTGTDGTLGIKKIKSVFGMTMVQDEKSAKYDGMPLSAISTGLIDYILPVEKMPDQLIKYTKHGVVKKENSINLDGDKYNKAFNKILILLRSQIHHDFSLYKRNTICRRIERRMHVNQIDNIDTYVTCLQKNEKEVHALFKDLLIGVTSFFRDKKAFGNLKDNFLTTFIERKPDNYNFRCWIPGCSTGEEAYTIAIIIQECMEKIGRSLDVQIFATDIDENAIDHARSGLYPLSISDDLSPEHLRKYFKKEDGHYRIQKNIRDMLVFASQNLFKDPPFTKIDLLSCRNLLIYFEPELQKKVLSIFHYSLKNNGILFLGSSESIGQATNRFKTQDRKHKIYTCETNSKDVLLDLELPASHVTEEILLEQSHKPAISPTGVNNLQLVETILEKSDTPPCVIIDENFDIVYVHGHTGKYLEPAIGQASVNILKMARPGLKAILSTNIRKVIISKQSILETNIEVQKDNGVAVVDIFIEPLQKWGVARGLIMIVFKEITRKTQKTSPGKTKKKKDFAAIEQELHYTKENLQSTIEELETSNEELKSTNEELQSTNEELQSTNEELETSKEELQSLNEESTTVNNELQSRIDELSNTTDDIKNFLNSTQIATIFLDLDLCIRRFTPKATELIPLSNTDIGRPISHFSTSLKSTNITEYAEQVLENLVILEKEVSSTDNRIIKLRILPYRTVQNLIDGVVITFEDISVFKRNEIKLRRLASVVTESLDALILQDFDGNIQAWNKGACQMYGYTESEALKMNILDLIPEDKLDELDFFMNQLKQKKHIDSFKTTRKNKDGQCFEIWLSATLLQDDQGTPECVATIEKNLRLLDVN